MLTKLKVLVRWVPVALGGCAGFFLDIKVAASVASDIITTLSIMAAFLVQVMLFVATIFQPGRLSAVRADRIVKHLEAEQERARFLFVTYIGVVFALVIVKFLESKDNFVDHADIIAQIFLTIAGFLLGYAFVGTWILIRAFAELQRLRNTLILDELRSLELERRQADVKIVQYVKASPGSADYGCRFDSK